MKFFIKLENNREAEIWDSGWRMGLLLGISITMIVLILVLYL
jgi:hypothetical protein